MSEPEEYAKIEAEAKRATAEVSELMLKAPGLRWLLAPLRRLMLWVARTCDGRLKDDGWRSKSGSDQ
jgi:hypothetical protein